MPAVSDSTPLICVAALGDFRLLGQLFGSITIPTAVYHEVAAGGHRPGAAEVREVAGSWLTVKSVVSRAEVRRLVDKGLHLGEAEAIVLARELSIQPVLMDDQDGVATARASGLEVVRTPALYVRAKQHGLIAAVRPKLDGLRHFGLWLRDSDYEAVLRRAGETPTT